MLRQLILFAILRIVNAEDIVPPKLLLISLDGLRYDFITPRRTPALWLLSRQGVFFERGVKVQVHTVTASNHHSIVTGLYQESHGIIDNAFWDPVLNDTYDVWNFRNNQTSYERSKLWYWYKGSTPIWQTNEDANDEARSRPNRRRSGSLYWPMGDCWINNRTIFRNLTWTDYGDELIWKKEMDTLITWLTDEKEPVNFALYYNAQPDHIEHQSSVYGPKAAATIEGVDSAMGYLIKRLRAVSLLDKINIILTADHGHTDIPDKDHILDLTPYLNYDQIIVNARSIFPKPGSNVTVEEIYDNLTRAQREKKMPMQVWLKEEFPEHYHYTKNPRIGPVIVYEDINYQLMFYGSIENYTREYPVPKSTHGWLNDYAEMRAFLIAHGPAFKNGLQVTGHEDIENIDLYPLMCKILGITPLPNNGSFDRIKFILRDEPGPTGSNASDPYMVQLSTPNVKIVWMFTAISIACVVALALLNLMYYYFHRKCGRWATSNAGDPNGYRLLRHASPEAYQTTTRRQYPNKTDPTSTNHTSAAGTSDGAGKNRNGNKSRSKSPEDGRRELVRLSDEDLSSDENEL